MQILWFPTKFAYQEIRWNHSILDSEMALVSSKWLTFQEFSGNTNVLQGFIFGPPILLLCIIDFSDYVFWNIAIYIDDITLYSNWDWASDLWQQFKLDFEFEPDLWETVNWFMKCLLDFNDEKTNLYHLIVQKNSDAIVMKMDWSVLDWLKPSMMMLLFWFFWMGLRALHSFYC